MTINNKFKIIDRRVNGNDGVRYKIFRRDECGRWRPYVETNDFDEAWEAVMTNLWKGAIT